MKCNLVTSASSSICHYILSGGGAVSVEILFILNCFTATNVFSQRFQMSGQRYKRTNFEDDEASSPAGTPPGITYDPSVAFKVGASFWQKRTNLEKLLVVALTIWSITMLVLFIMVASRTSIAAPAQNENICMSKSCVTTSSSILNALDVK